MNTNIYILIDPETLEIRYVGKTNNVKQRYSAHLNRARKHQTHKLNWINSLKKRKLKPIIEVIDEVPIEEWHFWEKYWISQIKTWGFNLTNYCGGGEGLTFGNQTSFKKGHIPWSKGTAQTKKCPICHAVFKCSPTKKQKTCSLKCGVFIRNGHEATQFKNGHSSWNKGLKGYTTTKRGYITSDETKEKQRQAKLGKPSKKKKVIIQYDKNMNFINEFESITEASIKTNINSISNALCEISKTAGGYIWKYK